MGVSPPTRDGGSGRRSIGSFAEAKLAALGCVKIKLQILAGNESAQAFYETMGYAVEERIGMAPAIVGGRTRRP